MIKKLLFLLLFIPVVSAYNIPDNSYTNMTEQETLITDFSDLNFYLNSTDYLNSLKIYSDVNTKTPDKTYYRVHTFHDDKGNILKIQFSYYVTHGFMGTSYSILRGSTVQYNGKTIVGTQEGKGFDDTLGHYAIFGIPLKTEVTEEIKFTNYNVVVIRLYSILPILKETEFRLPESFFIKNFKLADNYTDLSYTSMYMTTIDNTNDLFKIKLDIDSDYNDLNVVFKMIFSSIKGIMSIFNFFGFIQSEHDFYTMQRDFLNPIILLNELINFIILIARTIIVMGFVWTFTIIEGIILIYSYISDKDKDIITTLTKFFEISKSFWVVIFSPLKWMFEKVIKIWS